MKKILFVLLSLALAGAAHAAGDAEAGKAKANTCVACHGVNGISNNPMWPNLAGQKDQYMVKALKDYKGGNRQDPLMSPMAAPLSEQDMEDLAAYYSSLPAGGQ